MCALLCVRPVVTISGLNTLCTTLAPASSDRIVTARYIRYSVGVGCVTESINSSGDQHGHHDQSKDRHQQQQQNARRGVEWSGVVWYAVVRCVVQVSLTHHSRLVAWVWVAGDRKVRRRLSWWLWLAGLI